MTALHRLDASRVRDVAQMPGPAAQELFRLAAMGRKAWTLADWTALLAELDVCEETVAEWREFRE